MSIIAAAEKAPEQMVTLSVFIPAVISFFLMIVGLYVWTANQLGKIYETVNNHVQQGSIHIDKSEFVNQKVCVVQHRQITESLDEIKKDLKQLVKDNNERI